MDVTEIRRRPYLLIPGKETETNIGSGSGPIQDNTFSKILSE